MRELPKSVAEFLSSKRIAVAGVSRSGSQPANAIFKRLRDSGHDVVPVNPNASEIDGQPCYHRLGTIVGSLDAVMVVTHPDASVDVVRDAVERGIRRIWFHRSFGSGSVSEEAINECRKNGIEPIVGGCPMMYCDPVDIGHRCFRWWLGLQKRVPV
jgi:uncharacterized protein